MVDKVYPVTSTVTIPESALSNPGLGVVSRPLGYSTYVDPVGTARTCPAGHTTLKRYDGGEVIRIQPPIWGSGVLRFATFLYMIVENPGSARAHFAKVLGTTASLPGGRPLYPYLGVVHGRGGDDYGGCDPLAVETIEAGGKLALSDFRLDVVDNELVSDQPIPGWPDWTMTKAPDESQYPAIAVAFYVYQGAPLIVRNVMLMGVAV